MKISKKSILKAGLLLLFLLVHSGLFAGEIVIVKDNTVGPIQPHPQSAEYYPVSAYEDGIDLSVFFDWAVGDATITIQDANGVTVYQAVINTNVQTTVVIPIDNWNSGEYTIRISYGTTRLIGEFEVI